MADFVLSCCSTADLSEEHFKRRDISYICFHFRLNGQDYSDDLGRSIPLEDFYQAIKDGAETATSQVNISEYLEYFTAILEQGKDILHLSLSSGISGSYNSAVNAALIARERFPERKLYIVDSLAASSGYGLLMETLADKRDAGMGIDELRDWAEENKLRMHHWFFSTDLTTYIRGGRISKAAGFFGGILGICPLLNMDAEGRLVPREKIRSKKRVIERIVECMQATAEDGTNHVGKCFISQSACMEDARAVAELVEASFHKLNGKVLINWIGTTIGSHTGPNTVALFYWGSKRED